MRSDRGSVIVDERTNSIIITDTTDRLENFRRVISQLDIPVPQVLIEARIVTATANFSEELGIKWGGGYLNRNGASNALRVGGSETTLTELQDVLVGDDSKIPTPNDRVIMKLNVKQDTVGAVFNGVPSINTNEVETEVLVANGETVVLGGIFTTYKTFPPPRRRFWGTSPISAEFSAIRSSATTSRNS